MTAGLTGHPAPDRSVLLMTGSAAADVLQDVVTNDVRPVTAAPGQLVYAALLTPQGKYLFDFFLLAAPGGGILIDVAADRAQALAKRLSLYCIRRDAKVLGSVDVGVARILAAPDASVTAETPVEAFPSGALPASALPASALPEGVTAHRDPRRPELGWRLYATDPAAALAAMGLALGEDAVAGEDALRVALGVPATGIELVPEETFILEAGFDTLNGVDFRKGCYVGQEVTARMRHKTDLKKRLVTVHVEGSAPPGTPITTEAGKPAGTLFTQSGGKALAHLRLDRAKGPLSAGEARLRLA
ncbi:MAG: folate-binding protein [Pseudomonadota bacterium]